MNMMVYNFSYTNKYVAIRHKNNPNTIALSNKKIIMIIIRIRRLIVIIVMIIIMLKKW